MTWTPIRAVLRLVYSAMLASGVAPLAAQAAPIRDPVREFVNGFNPGDDDFFAHDTARTFLVRMRFDADLDGRADLALSETSVFGGGGGPWLLFRRQPAGGYRYLGEFFAGPSAVAVVRDATGEVQLTAGAAVSAEVTHLVRYRVTPGELIELSRTDSVSAGAAAGTHGPMVESCALSTYLRAAAGCWRPGWPKGE